jgi:hypothetical protein
MLQFELERTAQNPSNLESPEQDFAGENYGLLTEVQQNESLEEHGESNQD